MLADGAAHATTYFGVWARTPQLYYDEHGPYELVAARAVAELDAGRVPVVIAKHL